MASAARRPCRLARFASGTSVWSPLRQASTFSVASPTAWMCGSLVRNWSSTTIRPWPDLQAGSDREPGVGPHADREDDEVGAERAAVGEGHVRARRSRPARCRAARTSMPCSTSSSLISVASSGSNGGSTWSASSTGDREATMAQVLGELDADEPAADDHGRAGAVERGGDPVDIFHRAQRERTLHAGQVGYERRRAGGEHQRVVSLDVLVAGVGAPHAHGAGGGVEIAVASLCTRTSAGSGRAAARASAAGDPRGPR